MKTITITKQTAKSHYQSKTNKFQTQVVNMASIFRKIIIVTRQKKKHVSISNGNGDNTCAPYYLSFPTFLESTCPRKYRIAHKSWNQDIHARVEIICHLKTLYDPFLLVLRVLSGNMINVAASFISMVLERNILVRDDLPACVNNIDKQIADSIK